MVDTARSAASPTIKRARLICSALVQPHYDMSVYAFERVGAVPWHAVAACETAWWQHGSSGASACGGHSTAKHSAHWHNCVRLISDPYSELMSLLNRGVCIRPSPQLAETKWGVIGIKVGSGWGLTLGRKLLVSCTGGVVESHPGSHTFALHSRVQCGRGAAESHQTPEQVPDM